MDLIALVPLDYIVLALADSTGQGHWLVYANGARVLRMVRHPPPADVQAAVSGTAAMTAICSLRYYGAYTF